MILLYDGTLEGYFTALFLIFQEKREDYGIERAGSFVPDLFQQTRTVVSDPDTAHRVLEGIHTKISREALNIITRAFLSEGEGVEDLLCEYVRLGLKIGPAVTGHLADPVVSLVDRWSRKILREYHRYLGLIRFRQLSDGVFYAPIEPDGNLLPLLPAHFLDRFPDQRWIIHDVKRGTALLYDGKTIEMVQILETPEHSDGDKLFSSEENLYTRLWRRYYDSIGIENRRNLRLRMQFMPKKTWKYLPELDTEAR